MSVCVKRLRVDGMFLLVSVDFYRESGEGDSRTQQIPQTRGGPIHPREPALLVPRRKHLYASGDPGLPVAR